MKDIKFTSNHLHLVAVKIPLYRNFLCKDYEVELFPVPLDFYNDIKKNAKETYDDYYMISLSYYVYLLRFRKKFFKYVKSNVNNYEQI